MFERVGSLFRKTPSRLTLEQKLDLLAGFGFRLEEPFTVGNLLESWTREQYEEPGFETVLVGLGMTEEQPPWRIRCENMWHFDSECIEDHGSYAQLAERMKTLAQGSLPISDIRDHVDIEGGVAWLEFGFSGRPIHMDCRVQDDWVDTNLFARFVELLKESDPTKIFLYFDLKGQDCILACTTQEQYQGLKKTGLKFEPLARETLG